MLMALYFSSVLCQTSSTGLLVHLQRQQMNKISRVPMSYMGLLWFGFFWLAFDLLVCFIHRCSLYRFFIFAHEVGYLGSERLLNFSKKMIHVLNET